MVIGVYKKDKNYLINLAYSSRWLYSEYNEEGDDEDVDGLPDDELAKFGEWVHRQWEIDYQHMYDMSGEEVPLPIISDLVKEFRKKPIVHMTDHEDAITKAGFKGGIMDPQNLAYTRSVFFRDDDGGLFFGYDANKVERHARGNHGWKYGSNAVFFYADGVEIYHYADEEPQVIFDASTVYGKIIPIYNGGSYWWIESENGEDEFDTLQDAVDHLITAIKP